MNTVFLRHLEDIEDLSLPDRDGGIKPTELIHSPGQAAKVVEQMDKLGTRKLSIVSSPLKRTMQTVNAMVNEVKNLRCDTEVELAQDDRLTSLSHGMIVLPDDYKQGEKVPIERVALLTWVDECITKENLLYKFGDPYYVNGKARYPELIGKYSELGESRLEYLIRVYEFILDQFSDTTLDGSLKIISSHIPVIMDICAIIKAVKDISKDSILKVVPLGSLPNIKWDKSLEDDIYDPVYTIVIDAEVLREYLAAIEVERDVMLAIKLQNESYNEQ